MKHHLRSSLAIGLVGLSAASCARSTLGTSTDGITTGPVGQSQQLNAGSQAVWSTANSNGLPTTPQLQGVNYRSDISTPTLAFLELYGMNLAPLSAGAIQVQLQCLDKDASGNQIYPNIGLTLNNPSGDCNLTLASSNQFCLPVPAPGANNGQQQLNIAISRDSAQDVALSSCIVREYLFSADGSQSVSTAGSDESFTLPAMTRMSSAPTPGATPTPVPTPTPAPTNPPLESTPMPWGTDSPACQTAANANIDLATLLAASASFATSQEMQDYCHCVACSYMTQAQAGIGNLISCGGYGYAGNFMPSNPICEGVAVTQFTWQ